MHERGFVLIWSRYECLVILAKVGIQLAAVESK
jgi:hypothetical protein